MEMFNIKKMKISKQVNSINYSVKTNGFIESLPTKHTIGKIKTPTAFDISKSSDNIISQKLIKDDNNMKS